MTSPAVYSPMVPFLAIKHVYQCFYIDERTITADNYHAAIGAKYRIKTDIVTTFLLYFVNIQK